ncbi:uncharacterized protein [Mobula birostris]|uniref:uncharacterized protein isoform X2 n=1 Tax=Mobula birostris TaxID=1983395 RepID=UPI003B27D30E
MEGDDNRSSSPGASQEFLATSQVAGSPPSQSGQPTPENRTGYRPEWDEEKELDWNSASLMERMQGNCAGRSENQTWDWSSESDTDAFDLDSNVSEEELNEEYDYLRSLLQIVGKPPPFRYYTEFENAMNSPRIGSSFPFLHAGVCSKKDREEGRESPSRGDDGLSLDQGISATVNSADEGESSSLGGVSQNKKARYSGVVAPFAMRTLSHPSFQSFYTAVSYRQRQSPITEIGSSTFKNKDSVDSCSSADSKAKYEATGFHSQAIDMPALHQCEFFYTDPMLPSGYRVYNHLSLPTRQMLQGLQLNSPPPIMSTCVAPTNIQRTVPSLAPPHLNRCEGQNRPISKAEHDAISTLLELKHCAPLDCAEAETPSCSLKGEGILQPEAKVNGIHLSGNSGTSGIKDGDGTEQKHLSFLHDCNSSLRSHHDMELPKMHHVSLPDCKYTTPPPKYHDHTWTSRVNGTSSGTEVKIFDPVISRDILPVVAQETEIGKCDFLAESSHSERIQLNWEERQATCSKQQFI